VLSCIKKHIYRVYRDQCGQVMPIVLVLLVLGIFLIVPLLNYISTNLKAGTVIEKNVKGLYAAEAGVEDALWLLKNDTPALMPHSYQLTGINGMTVDVTIDTVVTLYDEETGLIGTHADWLAMTKTVEYSEGIYNYSLVLTNNGDGNMKVEMIMIDFPSSLEYVNNSTTGDITTDNPDVNGSSMTGIALVWDIPVPHPTIVEGGTATHTFQLSGPPDIAGIEGHGFVRMTREDIGTVWDGDSNPYKIIAVARDSNNSVVSTIRAGAWLSNQVNISCWQINP